MSDCKEMILGYSELVKTLSPHIPALQEWPKTWFNLELHHQEIRRDWAELLNDSPFYQMLLNLSIHEFQQLVVEFMYRSSSSLLTFSETPEIERLIQKLRYEFIESHHSWRTQPKLASKWVKDQLIELIKEQEWMSSDASAWETYATPLTSPSEWSDAEPDFDLLERDLPLTSGASKLQDDDLQTSAFIEPIHASPEDIFIKRSSPPSPIPTRRSRSAPAKPLMVDGAPQALPQAPQQQHEAQTEARQAKKRLVKDEDDPIDSSVQLVIHPSEYQHPPSLLENWLGEDAGRPGPLERLIERLSLISRVLYALSGLYSLLLLHLIDQLWDLVSSYIQGIFQGLMKLRSSLRVRTLRRSGRLAQGFAEDAAHALRLSQALLCLPQNPDDIFKTSSQAAPTQLLGLGLSTRAALDDLRRNLSSLPSGSLKQSFFKALKKWMIDLIPNPLNFFKPWITWLWLGFKSRFTRAEIIELNQSLIKEIQFLNQALKVNPSHQELTTLCHSMQAKIDRLLLITLQSYRHAQPNTWKELDCLMELALSQPSQQLHPLSASVLRAKLLEWIIASPKLSTDRKQALQIKLLESNALILQLKHLHARAIL